MLSAFWTCWGWKFWCTSIMKIMVAMCFHDCVWHGLLKTDATTPTHRCLVWLHKILTTLHLRNTNNLIHRTDTPIFNKCKNGDIRANKLSHKKWNTFFMDICSDNIYNKRETQHFCIFFWHAFVMVGGPKKVYMLPYAEHFDNRRNRVEIFIPTLVIRVEKHPMIVSVRNERHSKGENDGNPKLVINNQL